MDPLVISAVIVVVTAVLLALDVVNLKKLQDLSVKGSLIATQQLSLTFCRLRAASYPIIAVFWISEVNGYRYVALGCSVLLMFIGWRFYRTSRDYLKPGAPNTSQKPSQDN